MSENIFAVFVDDIDDVLLKDIEDFLIRKYFLNGTEAEEAELYNEYLLKSAPAYDSDNIFFELDENSAVSF